MQGYLGEFPVVIARSPFAGWDPARWALHFVEMYGGIDGAHHKQWLIDHVARILLGAPIRVTQARWEGGHAEYRFEVGPCKAYTKWVAEMKDGEDGPDTYSWDAGIAP